MDLRSVIYAYLKLSKDHAKVNFSSRIWYV